MELRRNFLRGALIALALAVAPAAMAQKFITVASTTSTEQSGLFKHLLPIFEKKTGVDVRVVALGTGQALDLARRGDADVVFVHARSAEETISCSLVPSRIRRRSGAARTWSWR
jgi:tungstate transport system substrate-binding protein